jgi:hypothetical protein
MVEFRGFIKTNFYEVYGGVITKIMTSAFPLILVVCLSMGIGPIVSQIYAAVIAGVKIYNI